ncbi:TonB-dependent receptor [Hallella bergensis]|uniref:SusC/RagA family TonB-linked outer membrane protein n=1 Tax=Hallella bergensis TaxID=242750 RepID=UPI0023F0D054|nr:TonB-dependent receptor [Hallella bergensis]
MKKCFIQLMDKRFTLYAALASTLILSLPLQSFANNDGIDAVLQAGKVKGQVLDDQGEPVIGASIKVKDDPSTGTVTDIDGNFSLNNIKEGTILQVSYIGYKTQEVRVGNGPVNVKLVEDNATLNEVVVVGFGTQKKVNLTGAVSVVTSEELASRPVQNVSQALQGIVPGLQIASNSGGALDASQSISVRGVGTIGEGSSGAPLILIDGVEGDINALNPQDIENISVLKDAAASSIYGSRAPFGVILITTKKGGSGKVTVNYNNSFRIGSLIRGKHMMNSVDFASWMNDTDFNSGNGVFFNNDRMAQIVAYHNATPSGPGQRITADGKTLYAIGTQNNTTWQDGYAYGIDDVDWYDVVYKKSTFSQEHNASVSGGNEKFNYYTSLNYLDYNGFMKLNSDTYKRYNGTAKISAQLASWIRMQYSMRFTRMDFKRPAHLTKGLYSDMARQGWPTLPLYDRNGYYYASPSPALGLATGGKDMTQRDIQDHQIAFNIEPIENWITHVDFNYKIDNRNRHWDSQQTFNHDVAGNPIIYNTGSNVHEDHRKDNYLNFQLYSEYTWSLAEKHNFHVMGGFQAEQLKRTEFGLQRDGIIDPNKPEVDLTSGLSYTGTAITPNTNGARNQWQTAGFFGRINYNYMERYLFEMNMRYDGTSRFRTDKMWKLFPSFSIGWNIAREDFFKPLENTINTLKLRASYGSLGNQNTKEWYQTYQTIKYSPFAGNWLINGSRPNVTVAPGLISTLLTWETVQSYNIGLDFGALNNRLTGTFDWYVRDTKNMVGNAPELPSILGTSVPKTNNTDLRTTGWEVQISWRDMLKNGLSYGITVNVSDARTKITRYPNNPTKSIDNYIEGRYMNEIWGYETQGIAKSQEEMDQHLAVANQSTIGDQWGAGDVMYRNINDDKQISGGARTLDDHGDLKVIGNSTPRYLFGIDLNAAWKGFDFRAFFQGVLKRDSWVGKSWNGNEYMFGATASGTWWGVGITGVQDYYRDANSWSVQNGYQSENTDAFLPRPTWSDKNVQVQDRYLINAAYMRLKNIQLGYSLPKSLISHLGLNNVRFYVSAENLWTICDMPDQFDPETIGYDTNGIKNNGYPLSKTWSFGLNLTF